MQRSNNREAIYTHFSFDLADLQSLDQEMLAECLKFCLDNKKYFIPHSDPIETNLFTNDLKKIMFLVKQEILFYKLNPNKAFILSPKKIRGGSAEVADVIGILRLNKKTVQISLTNQLIAKKFYVAKDEKKIRHEAYLAKRLSYLKPIKGPYYFNAPYGHYKRAIMVTRKVAGESLDNYLTIKEGSFAQTNARPLSILQRFRLLVALFRATMVVHAAGIVHRDFAPKNLLITLEPYCEAQWVDVGHARDEDEDDGFAALGTCIYFSSQAVSQLQTKADDWFATILIASELLGADQSHLDEDHLMSQAELFDEIKTKHANYTFHNLFHFISEADLNAQERMLLRDTLIQFVAFDPAKRSNPQSVLKIIEQVQLAVLRRSPQFNPSIDLAFHQGQMAREIVDNAALTNWLDFPAILSALDQFNLQLRLIPDEKASLFVFLEKAEFGILIQCETKASMQKQIDVWRHELVLISQQWEALQRSSRQAELFAAQTPALSRAQLKEMLLSDYFDDMPVRWNELPTVLASWTKKLTGLRAKLAMAQAPLIQLGSFAPPRQVISGDADKSCTKKAKV